MGYVLCVIDFHRLILIVGVFECSDCFQKMTRRHGRDCACIQWHGMALNWQKQYQRCGGNGIPREGKWEYRYSSYRYKNAIDGWVQLVQNRPSVSGNRHLKGRYCLEEDYKAAGFDDWVVTGAWYPLIYTIWLVMDRSQ